MNETTELLKFYKEQNTALWITVFILIFALLAGVLTTNILWMQYESQWEYEVSIEQDGKGTNIIGNGNEVDYGTENHD